MPNPVKDPAADPSKAGDPPAPDPKKVDPPAADPKKPEPMVLTDELKKQLTDAAIADYQRANGPPENYELKGPNGTELPKDFVERTTAIARASGLTQKQAEAVVPFIQQEVAARMQQVADDNKPGEGSAWKARDAEWRKQALAAPDVNGSQEKLLAKAETGRRVLTHLRTVDPTTAELEKFLDETGFGSHPAVVNFMATVGKLMKEADFIPPPAPPGNKDGKRVEDRLFPSTAKKES